MNLPSNPRSAVTRLAVLALSVVTLSLAGSTANAQTGRYDHLIAQADNKISSGEYAAAVRLGETAASLSPSRYEAFRVQGKAKLLAGNGAEAESLLAKAVERAPAGGTKDALKGLLQRAHVASLTATCARVATHALKVGDKLGAADAFEQAYRLDPSEAQMGLNAAMIFEEANQTQRALDLYRAIAATTPSSPSGLEARLNQSRLERLVAATNQAAADQQAKAQQTATDAAARAAEDQRRAQEKAAQDARDQAAAAQAAQDKQANIIRLTNEINDLKSKGDQIQNDLSQRRNSYLQLQAGLRQIQYNEQLAQQAIDRDNADAAQWDQAANAAQNNQLRVYAQLMASQARQLADQARGSLGGYQAAEKSQQDGLNECDRQIKDLESQAEKNRSAIGDKQKDLDKLQLGS